MDSLTDQLMLWRRQRVAVLVLAAVILCLSIVVWWFGGRTRGTALLIGVVLLYLAAGTVIAWWRTELDHPLRWGLIAGAVGLGAGVVLFSVLGRAPTWLVLSLAVITPFSLPPGVALLSEAAIERLAAPGAGRFRGGAIAAGVLLVVVVAAVATELVGSSWALLAFVALGLLVVALASSTMADIVVVLAVVALMGVTPQPAPGPAHPPARGDVLVALGDSYMSGEGAATFYEGTDEGGGNNCRRAPTAWAALAGQEPQFDGLDFLACSGARTYNLRERDERPPSPPLKEQEHLSDAVDTQLRQYRAHEGDYHTELVVISIGGNDAGFATIGQMCVAPGDCSTEEDIWLAGLDEVERELRRTYAQVRDVFNETPVVVIPYPSPIAAEDASGRATQCDQIALNSDERTFITRFLNALNGRIRAAADEAGFYYLAEMRNALRTAHLQLCDPENEGRPDINFIGLRSVNGAAEQRFNPTNWAHNSLHPNERGHAAMLRTFQIWRAEHPDPAVQAPDAPGIEEAGRPVPGTSNCSVYDKEDSGCRAQGSAWALQQVGRLGLTWGWVALAAAGGAWLAAVGFFGWRRFIVRRPEDDPGRPRTE